MQEQLLENSKIPISFLSEPVKKCTSSTSICNVQFLHIPSELFGNSEQLPSALICLNYNYF
jgi:hypothetical protein